MCNLSSHLNCKCRKPCKVTGETQFSRNGNIKPFYILNQRSSVHAIEFCEVKFCIKSDAIFLQNLLKLPVTLIMNPLQKKTLPTLANQTGTNKLGLFFVEHRFKMNQRSRFLSSKIQYSKVQQFRTPAIQGVLMYYYNEYH